MHRRLPLAGGPNLEAFFFRPCEGSDGQGLVIHDEVVADEPVMPGALAAIEDWFGRVEGSDETTHRQGDRRQGEELCRPG